MDSTLKKLQETQTEILNIIDRICREHDIKYSLYAGSLLGAVRHEGFIPWDDDLDICMMRSDYDKFIKIWEELSPEGYILQNKENTRTFTQTFTKIRKEHTTFLQYDFERGAYHTGIFVDIFPMDRIPNGGIKKILFRWNCMKYILFTREFIPEKSSTYVKFVSKMILNTTPKRIRMDKRSKLLKKITKYKEGKKYSIVGIETIDSLRKVKSYDIFDEIIELPFENNKICCIKKWDEELKIHYGDYMKLPPVEERTWTHHPIILDFEHSYEELVNE